MVYLFSYCIYLGLFYYLHSTEIICYYPHNLPYFYILIICNCVVSLLWLLQSFSITDDSQLTVSFKLKNWANITQCLGTMLFISENTLPLHSAVWRRFNICNVMQCKCALNAFYQYIIVLAPRTASSAHLQHVCKNVVG